MKTEKHRLSLLIQPQSYWIRAPTCTTSFNLDYFLKTLPPNTVTLGFRASIFDFGGTGRGTIQFMAVSTVPEIQQKIFVV